MSEKIHIRLPNLPDDWPLRTFNIQTLFIKEGLEWQAIALDMDVEAFGSTLAEAREALIDMVIAQVTFAIQKKQPQLVLKAAQPEYWQIYQDTRRAEMQRLIAGDEPQQQAATAHTGELPIPPELLAQYQKRKPFKRQHGG